MAYFSRPVSNKDDMRQKLDKINSRISTERNSILAQQDALRKATLLKHRKVSTQLKLDMVHRQLSSLRRSVHESDSNHQFYRNQVDELSNELQNLGTTLERIERNDFFVRRRILSGCDGYSESDENNIQLSSSHPAIYSSSENLERKFHSSVRSGLKSRAIRLLSTPPKMRKKLFFNELRSVASLSSLNIKSGSQTTLDEDPIQKDTKPRKGPLKFLGNLVDNQFRRKFWNSTKRTKSAGNVLDQKNKDDMYKNSDVIRTMKPNVVLSYTSSSSSEDSDDGEEEFVNRTAERSVIDVKNEVEKSDGQHATVVRTEVDPNLLAEIEDFEKMAAQFINQHSQRTTS